MFWTSYAGMSISTFMRLLQPSNAAIARDVKPFPIVTDVRPLQEPNAASMLVTLSGMVMVVSPVHPSND